MGPVEQVIELNLIRVHKGSNGDGGIRGFLFNLLCDQIKSAMAVVVIGPENAVVPLMPVVMLLMEGVQFLL